MVNINNDFVNKPEWIIYTDGTSLLELFNHPLIDFTKTISNDIQEIYEILGIEAARTAIINELIEVIEEAASYVNSRHIALIADTMTSRGGLMSVDRHGIKKSENGPFKMFF